VPQPCDVTTEGTFNPADACVAAGAQKITDAASLVVMVDGEDRPLASTQSAPTVLRDVHALIVVLGDAVFPQQRAMSPL